MTGSAIASSTSTASCSIIVPSSGTSGTAVAATAFTRWSATTSWPRETARAANSWNPSPTAISATGLPANEMTYSVVKRARRTVWRLRVELQEAPRSDPRMVSPPSTSSSAGSPSTNSPSAGSRKSTTVCGSTSVPSWPKTSPAARRSAGVLRAKPKIAPGRRTEGRKY